MDERNEIEVLKVWIKRGEDQIKDGIYYKETHRETTVMDVRFWKIKLAKLEKEGN